MTEPKALILDTETHTLNGYPIEIAFAPCAFAQGVLVINQDQVFDEYFSCPEPISLGAMAVHHILEADIAEKPSYDTFRMPENVEYLIGHNINYDIEAVQKCQPDFKVKGICTLALARMIWGDLETHTLGALYYFVMSDKQAVVAQFVKRGGQIKPAVNTNKAEFNYCNADTVLQSAERPNSHQNHILRTRAEKQGLKSYKPVAPCRSCGTSERSVKSNICLECDRRRARAKTGLSSKNLEAIGHYLLGKGEAVEFTSGGKKYVLKVEVA